MLIWATATVSADQARFLLMETHHDPGFRQHMDVDSIHRDYFALLSWFTSRHEVRFERHAPLLKSQFSQNWLVDSCRQAFLCQDPAILPAVMQCKSPRSLWTAKYRGLSVAPFHRSLPQSSASRFTAGASYSEPNQSADLPGPIT
jgi:hypothetical protein